MDPRLAVLATRENGVYFFHYASQCLVWPFLPLFLSRYESDAALGALMGACRVTSVVAAPLWAYGADRWKSRRFAFGGAWLGWQALTVLLLCAATSSTGAAVLGVAVLRAVFEAPITPFVDAGVLRSLEENGGGDFGKARLFGSIAWGGIAPLGGIAFDRFGFGPNVAVSVCLSVAMAACARRLVESASKPDAKPGYAAVEDETVVNPFSIVGDDDDDEEASDGELSTRSPATVLDTPADSLNPFDVLKDDDEADDPPWRRDDALRGALARRPVVVFLACVATVGAGFGFVMNFLFVYVTRRLGGTPFLCGVALMVECVVEVPCLHYADDLLRAYGSRTLIVTVLALYAVRCASYALLDAFAGRPALVLLVEPLHGVTFALFYTSGVSCAKELLPATWETLAQGLFSAAFTGGSGLGAALGGVAVKRFGFHKTFLAFAAMFAVAAIAFSSTLDDDDDDGAAPAPPRRSEEEEDDDDDESFRIGGAGDDGGGGIALRSLNLREYDYDEGGYDGGGYGDYDDYA